MAKSRLDINLLEKLSDKTRKPVKYLREQISKRADRSGISSEAALILWAKNMGIGTAVYKRSLPSNIQEEVRSTLPSIFTTESKGKKPLVAHKEKARFRKKSTLSLAIEYLIQDQELRDRCGDLLKAKRNFDRVFREATTIMDDRIKKLAGLGRMKPLDAVGKALNPDPQKAILKVSDEKYEQDGFYSICKGLVLAFRDPTHHKLSDQFSREDALKFCGFVDALLTVLGKAKKPI